MSHNYNQDQVLKSQNFRKLTEENKDHRYKASTNSINMKQINDMDPNVPGLYNYPNTNKHEMQKSNSNSNNSTAVKKKNTNGFYLFGDPEKRGKMLDDVFSRAKELVKDNNEFYNITEKNKRNLIDTIDCMNKDRDFKRTVNGIVFTEMIATGKSIH